MPRKRQNAKSKHPSLSEAAWAILLDEEPPADANDFDVFEMQYPTVTAEKCRGLWGSARRRGSRGVHCRASGPAPVVVVVIRSRLPASGGRGYRAAWLGRMLLARIHARLAPAFGWHRGSEIPASGLCTGVLLRRSQQLDDGGRCRDAQTRRVHRSIEAPAVRESGRILAASRSVAT
jgi:hypothetical protein